MVYVFRRKWLRRRPPRLTAVGPTTVALVAVCSVGAKAFAPGGVAIAATALTAAHSFAPGGVALPGVAHTQAQARAPGGVIVHAIAKAQAQARAPGGVVLPGVAKTQAQARAPGGVVIYGKPMAIARAFAPGGVILHTVAKAQASARPAASFSAPLPGRAAVFAHSFNSFVPIFPATAIVSARVQARGTAPPIQNLVALARVSVAALPALQEFFAIGASTASVRVQARTGAAFSAPLATRALTLTRARAPGGVAIGATLSAVSHITVASAALMPLTARASARASSSAFPTVSVAISGQLRTSTAGISLISTGTGPPPSSNPDQPPYGVSVHKVTIGL